MDEGVTMSSRYWLKTAMYIPLQCAIAFVVLSLVVVLRGEKRREGEERGGHQRGPICPLPLHPSFSAT